MKRVNKSQGIVYDDNKSRRLTKKERLEQELNAKILLGENRQTIQEVIDQRIIKAFWIGRRCTGTQLVWIKEEGKDKRVAVPKYKLTRWQIEFEDGLKLNVDKTVFGYYKKGKAVQYFNFYD